MTSTKGMEAIKELSVHSLSWYKEGNVKSENKDLQVVLNQINNFENNMNIINEEVRMAQHKYETSMEGRISNLEETLKNFIKESQIRFSTPEDDNCLSIDMVDKAVLDHVQEILPSSLLDSFLFEPIIKYQQRSNTNLWEEEDDDLDDLNKSGSSFDLNN
ncbi:hypothetical protein Tco_1351692 [Tanacetum coccineum]